MLAADFNVTELYRQAHGIADATPSCDGRSGRACARGDLRRACSRRSTGRCERFAARRFDGRGGYDRLTVTALANLGLSTQLVVLGVCLVLGAPTAYLWFVLACLVALVPLQLRAERQARQTAPRSVTR